MPTVDSEFWECATERRLAEIGQTIQAERDSFSPKPATFEDEYERMRRLQDVLLALQLQEEQALEHAVEVMRNRLRKEEREINLQIAALCNSRLPVSRLPPEILTRIFAYRADVAYPKFSKPLNRSWIAVTHVCQCWRNAALACPGLWVNVTDRFGDWWLETVIARSQDMPRLSFSIIPAKTEDTGKDLPRQPLLDNLPRMHRLSLTSRCDGPEQLQFYAHFFRKDALYLQNLILRAPGAAGIPWTLALMQNLATLTIDLDDHWTTEATASPDAPQKPCTLEVVAILQRLQNLTQLDLRGGFFRYSDIHGDIENTTARLSALEHLCLHTTIEAASVLLKYIRIPSTATAVFHLYYKRENADDIASLFHHIRSVPSLLAQDGTTTAPLISKLVIRQLKTALARDIMEIRAGARKAPLSQLTICLAAPPSGSGIFTGVTPWETSIWRLLQAPWSAVSTFASEDLEELDMCDWLVRGGPGWADVMEKAPNVRTLHASSFSALALCVALSEESTPAGGRVRSGDSPGQNLPLAKLATLIFLSVDFGKKHLNTYSNDPWYPSMGDSTDPPAYLVREMLRIRSNARVGPSKLYLMKGLVPGYVRDFLSRREVQVYVSANSV
ncbi:hypothetical protein FA95DRAFT_1609509 [Auriscalpium vulgare]|uniref:Uncharacterized protein n=1 Tax=Auriscalpium vulgare TaxID=40419 RepID=A0ACB8RI48_9AGAM|nr:hypothetical protein FA95DRAFT_1609509 [Auriscalpium vulgare]